MQKTDSKREIDFRQGFREKGTELRALRVSEGAGRGGGRVLNSSVQ